MFDVAVESDVRERRRRSQAHQSVRVECPFTILVAENQFPSLMGGWKDDHERPQHIRSSGGIFMCLEKRVFA